MSRMPILFYTYLLVEFSKRVFLNIPQSYITQSYIALVPTFFEHVAVIKLKMSTDLWDNKFN